VLEERTYSLQGDVLQFLINGDAAAPVNLVTRMLDFQVRAFLEDGSVQDTFDTTDAWADLQSIEISVTAEMTSRGRTTTRTLISRFFPRNVLSL
jgi:hypothetical protein